MKFIYFGNGNYNSEQDIGKKIIQHINTLDNYDIIIYGGNYKTLKLINKENNQENNIGSFLNTINTLDNKKNNLILFGDYDLSSTNIFQTEIDFYKKSNDKFKIFNNVTNNFIIDNFIIIIFDSTLLLFPNLGELVVNTIYQNLFDDFSKNENIDKNKTIKDLIDYQFESILKVIKKNSNKKNIIFITQNALFTGNQELILFFKWLSDFYLFLNSYKIYWLCSNLSIFESGTINISNEKTNILNITQYIVGTGGGEQINSNNTKQNYLKSLSVESEYTSLTEKINISYTVIKSSNIFGYLEFEEDLKKFNFKNIDEQENNLSDTEINFNFNEKKDNNRSNIFAKKSKYSREYKNIFKNIEITGISDNLNNISINTQETDNDDPYKARYHKYKAKLLELRKNKKNKN
jgi:hypothetical protein